MKEIQDKYNPLTMSGEFISDVHSIIEKGRQQAYASVGKYLSLHSGMWASESLRKSSLAKPAQLMASSLSRIWQKRWCQRMVAAIVNAIWTTIENSICSSPIWRL